MLRGRNRLDRYGVIELEERQCLLVFERLGVALFARLAIQREKAVELDDGARGAEQVRMTLRRNVKIDRGRIEHRRSHLRCHETLPDQFIQFELIGGELLGKTFVGTARGFGGTYAFVGVLRVGLAARIELHARREIRLPIFGFEPVAGGTGRRF